MTNIRLHLKIIFSLCLLTSAFQLSAQNCPEWLQVKNRMDLQVQNQILQDYHKVKPYFDYAYEQFPSIPRGMLEAVAFTYTRFYDNLLDAENDSLQMPSTCTVMGLMLNGRGVFRENLREISQLSGASVEMIKHDNQQAIWAYAKAFSVKQEELNCFGDRVEIYKPVLIALSELPIFEQDSQSFEYNFPINSSLYAIYSFLSDPMSEQYGAPMRTIDFDEIFGKWLPIVRQKKVMLSAPSPKNVDEVDYPNALLCMAADCNYSVGRSVQPNNVVVHYTAGTYAGAIAWFQNCSAQVSAHYVIRSFDGQVTQMVREMDKAWHVGSENGYTIGLEHEAYGNVASFFTTAMYGSSADLVRDICHRWPSINPLRMFYRDTLDDGTALNYGLHSLGGYSACVQIRGHQHYPNQTHTDPGPFWNWNYYFKLVNANPVITESNNVNGTFTDSGGMLGDYGNDERQLFRIYIPGADSIVLNFSEFNLEQDYDFMWIYEGATVFSPLLGRWNTQSPGRVVAHGENMLIEFRSDCLISAGGWVANWQGYSSVQNQVDTTPPSTSICWDEQDWVTSDFIAQFIDTDDVALKYRFYQVMEKPGSVWTANPQHGFLCDNFDANLDTTIWINDNHWVVQNGKLQHQQTNATAVLSARLNGQKHNAYLLDFYLTMNVGSTFSVFFDLDQPLSPLLASLNGYELRMNQEMRTVSLIRWIEGTPYVVQTKTVSYLLQQPVLYRVIWDRNSNEVALLRHARLILTAQDTFGVSGLANFIGFRADSMAVTLDNLRVYGSRPQDVLLSVGADSESDIQTQSTQGVAVCKLKSVVVDSAWNVSTLMEKRLKVDYTPPTPPSVVDVSNSVQNSAMLNDWTWVAHWSGGEDEHSGIAGYEYGLDMRQNNSSVSRIQWIPVGETLSAQGLVHLDGTAQLQLVVRSVNGAGLKSIETHSANVGAFPDNRYSKIRNLCKVCPNPAADYIQLQWIETAAKEEAQVITESAMLLRYEFYDASGRLLKVEFGSWGQYIDVSELPSGIILMKVYDKKGLFFFQQWLKR